MPRTRSTPNTAASNAADRTVGDIADWLRQHPGLNRNTRDGMAADWRTLAQFDNPDGWEDRRLGDLDVPALLARLEASGSVTESTFATKRSRLPRSLGLYEAALDLNGATEYEPGPVPNSRNRLGPFSGEHQPPTTTAVGPGGQARRETRSLGLLNLPSGGSYEIVVPTGATEADLEFVYHVMKAALLGA